MPRAVSVCCAPLLVASIAWLLAGCDDEPSDTAPDADSGADTTADLPAETTPDVEREPGLPPELESIAPNAGPLAGGQQITATGRRFGTPTEVFFDDTEALSVQVVDERSLSILVPPANAPGLVDVRVVTADGEAVLERAYTYLASDEPFVVNVEPDRGDIAGGDEIVVTGTNFPAEGLVQVIFGGSAATVALDSDTRFTVVTPAHDYGFVPVTVNFDGRVQVLPNEFLYWTDLAVDSLLPIDGSADGGTTVIFLGAGFVDGANIEVHFGDALADPVAYVFEGEELGVVTPAGGPGLVDVTIEGDNGRVVLEDAFTYQP